MGRGGLREAKLCTGDAVVAVTSLNGWFGCAEILKVDFHEKVILTSYGLSDS